MKGKYIKKDKYKRQVNFPIYIYNSLNTKENHKRVRSTYVIKTHVPLYVKKKFNFFGLQKINFQTSFAN